MKKRLLPLLALLYLCLIIPTKVLADVPNPEYFTARCEPGEIEVKCTWHRTDLDSPIISECDQYENDPNYRFLSGTGSTFGGSSKYCFKATSASSYVRYLYHTLKGIIPILLLTLVLEIPIFALLGFRSKRALISVLLVNVISVPLLYILMMSVGGFYMLIFLEALVTLLEVLLLKLMTKESLKRVVFATIAANVISAFVGTLASVFVLYLQSPLSFI